MVKLDVELAPNNPRELRLANPIVAASGCFGFGDGLAGIVDTNRLGAFISATVTERPRRRDRHSSLIPTPAGLLYVNSLANPGLRSFRSTYPRNWERWSIPAIASIAGASESEFASLVEALDEVNGVAGVELNLTLPLCGDPDRRVGDDAETVYSVVGAVRDATSLPTIVKLNAPPANVVECAQAAEEGGADALSLINALDGLAVDGERQRIVWRQDPTFLVGPATKPIVLRQVHDVVGAVTLPVIATGGVASLNDLLDYLMVGASAVAVGSAVFADPGLPDRLVTELTDWMTERSLPDLGALIGVARRDALRHLDQAEEQEPDVETEDGV